MEYKELSKLYDDLSYLYSNNILIKKENNLDKENLKFHLKKLILNLAEDIKV